MSWGWGQLTGSSGASIEGNIDGITCSCGTVECDADNSAGCEGSGESLGQRKTGGEAENVLHSGNGD